MRVKPQTTIADLLGQADSEGPQPAGRIPQHDPARLLHELNEKLELLIGRHRAELQASERPARRKVSRKI